MNLVKRLKSPSPKFFKVLRNIGLAMAAVGGTILAAPIALPVVLTTVGGYLAVVGGVVSAVSQLTTVEEETADPEEGSGFKAGPGSPDPSIPRSLDKLGTGSTRGRLNSGKAQLGTGLAQPDIAPDEHW